MGLVNKHFEARLEKLHKVETELKKLEAQEKELKAALLEDFKDSGIQTLSMPFGTYFLNQRVKWEYSERLVSLKDLVKESEKKEQETGVAEKSVTTYLAFRESK